MESDEGHNVVEAEDGAGLTSNQRATIRFAILFGLALTVGVLAAKLAGGS